MKTRTFYAIYENKGIICEKMNSSTTRAGDYIICTDAGSGADLIAKIAYLETLEEAKTYCSKNCFPAIIDSNHFLWYEIVRLTVDDDYWDEEGGDFATAEFEMLEKTGYCDTSTCEEIYPKELLT